MSYTITVPPGYGFVSSNKSTEMTGANEPAATLFLSLWGQRPSSPRVSLSSLAQCEKQLV